MSTYPNVPINQTSDTVRRFGQAINYLLDKLPDVGGINGTAGQYIPLVNGAEPPVLVSDGTGQLILVAWNG